MQKYLEVFIVFFKLGCTSFGGPVAHVAFFRKALVEQRNWLSEKHFAELFSLCQILPGPASSQLGFAIGWHRAGLIGAWFAFIGFTLPTVLLLISIVIWVRGSEHLLFDYLIHGFKLLAVIVVTDAVFSMAKKLCPSIATKLIALVCTVLLLTLSSVWVQVTVIVLSALLAIVIFKDLDVKQDHAINLASQATYFNRAPKYPVALILFVLLLIGLPILHYVYPDAFLIQWLQAFYQTGSLVFGGGHVVLPMLETFVVGQQWIDKEAFLAGYGLTQAMPGPMFAFAAYIPFAGIESLHYPAWLLCVLSLGMIFLPGFLLLIALLPKWHKLSSNKIYTKACIGINAAVVGILGSAWINPVILNSIKEPLDIGVILIGILALVVRKLNVLWLILYVLIVSCLRYGLGV